MKKEQIQEFTRRISQSNRSELVVVTYDIFFAYLADAGEAYRNDDPPAFKEALRGGQRAVEELMRTLALPDLCVLPGLSCKSDVQV